MLLTVATALTLAGASGACSSSGQAGGTASTAPTTTAPTASGTTGAPVPSTPTATGALAYDLTGYDKDAICATIRTIATNWNGTVATSPPPSDPREQFAYGKPMIDAMLVAAGELAKVAPADLARDYGAQVESARSLFEGNVFGAKGSVPTSSPAPVSKVRLPQIDAYTKATCGFSFSTYTP